MSRTMPEYDDKPLVSIIIPCYNAEAYVGEAIESALGQTYPNVAVIVIDDGSTDGSLEVIRGFGSRVRWGTGPNRGGGAARNQGLALARGELVQFLDADDLLYRNRLAVIVPAALSSPSTVVYSAYDNRDQNGNVLGGLKAPPRTHEDPVSFVLNHIGLQTSAPLHRWVKLVAIGGFREDLPCAQERDLHLRLACDGVDFRYLPDRLFVVRRIAGSVSSDYIKVLDQHEHLARAAFDILAAGGRLTEGHRAAFAGFLARDARAYLQRGYPDRAIHYLELAKAIHPQGGLDAAYRPLTRALVRILGVERVERLVSWKRHSLFWKVPT